MLVERRAAQPITPLRLFASRARAGAYIAAFTPLTAAGVAPEDAGAASGLVNVAHQLGGSLGLGVLVTVFASATPDGLGGRELLAHRVATSLGAGSLMLALALAVVVAAVGRPARERSPVLEAARSA